MSVQFDSNVYIRFFDYQHAPESTCGSSIHDVSHSTMVSLKKGVKRRKARKRKRRVKVRKCMKMLKNYVNKRIEQESFQKKISDTASKTYCLRLESFYNKFFGSKALRIVTYLFTAWVLFPLALTLDLLSQLKR